MLRGSAWLRARQTRRRWRTTLCLQAQRSAPTSTAPRRWTSQPSSPSSAFHSLKNTTRKLRCKTRRKALTQQAGAFAPACFFCTSLALAQTIVILTVAVFQARGPRRQVFVAAVEKEGRTRFCFFCSRFTLICNYQSPMYFRTVFSLQKVCMQLTSFVLYS